MARNRLYAILLAACVAGLHWVAYAYQTPAETTGVCIIKHTTHVPCPSCGSTRSVLSLLHGDVSGAMWWNPLGFILLAIMVVTPIWILFDLATRKSTLHKFYHKAELMLKRRWIALPAIALVLVNWVWNIYKGI